MGFELGDVTKALSQGERGAAQYMTNEMTKAGHVAAGVAGKLMDRLPGGMKLGSRVFGAGAVHGLPQSSSMSIQAFSPQPSDLPIDTTTGTAASGLAYGSGLEQWGKGRPFVLAAFVPIAAGAQTTNTTIFDFHAVASNPSIITTADLIRGNVEVYEAYMSVGVRNNVTLSGIENIAYFSSWWVQEAINSIEVARWSFRQLGWVMSSSGLLTSGASAGFFSYLNFGAVEFHRKYDPNIPAALNGQPSVTGTTISPVDFGLTENGVRP
jgi:hypothetical protein